MDAKIINAKKCRIEKDYLGEKKIPSSAYYGIHTARAIDNFSISGRTVNRYLIEAMVLVKKACAVANSETGFLDTEKSRAIVYACDKILEGEYSGEFVTDCLQGGAGTSTNMNVNEVIANVALEYLGKSKGDYKVIHPIDHVNMSQSTNDVYPTALRIAAILKVRQLSEELSLLQDSLQQKESEFSKVLKLGRTQFMDALPIMLGQEFSAYAQAIARDRWRIYKLEERLRQTALGGTAIGTGLNADREYIYKVTELIREYTGLGLARAEFMVDIIQNNDVFVEVSGLLKSCAVNLIKISNDLRLLSSGPRGGIGEINLPACQAGSSIMPGKINPVIAEMTAQASLKVIGNDSNITQAAAYGVLELNAFSPLIAESLLESLTLLCETSKKFRTLCIDGITANKEKCLEHLFNSTALATALVHRLGYEEASEIALESLDGEKSIEQIVLDRGLIPAEELTSIFNPTRITSPGIPK